jgi:hypothetical protein
MVKLTSLLSAAFLPLALISAADQPNQPDPYDPYGGGSPICLTDREASEIRRAWISLFVKLDVNLAKEILTVNFAVYSASENFYLGKDVRLPCRTTYGKFLVAKHYLDQRNHLSRTRCIRYWHSRRPGNKYRAREIHRLKLHPQLRSSLVPLDRQQYTLATTRVR